MLRMARWLLPRWMPFTILFQSASDNEVSRLRSGFGEAIACRMSDWPADTEIEGAVSDAPWRHLLRARRRVGPILDSDTQRIQAGGKAGRDGEAEIDVEILARRGADIFACYRGPCHHWLFSVVLVVNLQSAFQHSDVFLSSAAAREIARLHVNMG